MEVQGSVDIGGVSPDLLSGGGSARGRPVAALELGPELAMSWWERPCPITALDGVVSEQTTRFRGGL